MMIVKMAFSSLFSHKNKTILILVILSLSTCITLLGFLTYHSFEMNMRKSLTESISGDIIIHNSEQTSEIDIVNSTKDIVPIDDYSELTTVLDSIHSVDSWSPLCRGSVLLNDPRTNEYIIPLPVVGADIESYMDIFKKLRIVEGTDIPNGEDGILISKSTIEEAQKRIELMRKRMSKNNMLKEYQNIENNNAPNPKEILSKMKEMSQKMKEMFKPGNTIKVAGMTINRSMRIMELKIFGIVDMEGIEGISNQNSIINMKAYQKMTGYDAESDIMTIEQLKKLEENRKYMLEFKVENETGESGFDESSLDEFFDDMIDEETAVIDDYVNEEDFELNLEKYREVGDDQITIDNDNTGKTDLIVLRLNNSSEINATVNQLNDIFTRENLNLKAISYIESSISLGSYINLVTIIISLIIFLILVISIIIITNAVLMNIIDRTAEIGTMMAIGAKRSFIFLMILGESIIISLITTVIGFLIGIGIIGIVSIMYIPATDNITMMLFGGSTLNLSMNFINFVYTFFIMLGVTAISTIYPLIFSTRLTPLEAMNKV